MIWLQRSLVRAPWHIEPGPVLLVLAAIAGILGGLGVVCLHTLLSLLHNLFFLGRIDLFYDPRQHTPPSAWGPAIVFAPVLGGLISVFLTRRFALASQGSGVPDVLLSLFYHRGHVHPDQAFFQPIATAFSIGSGGSGGREGPSMHIGAALASGLAEVLRLPARSHMALVSCGLAAGIAAAFNAPFGGWLFALEIATLEWSPAVILAVLVAAWSGALVGRLFYGDFRLLPIVPVSFGSLQDWWVCLPLGVLTALSAWAFIFAVRRCRTSLDRMPGNIYLQHASAMLLVGFMIYVFFKWTGHYAVEGIGYGNVLDLFNAPLPSVAVLLALLAAKFLVTVLTLGTGGSGGIFSPSMMIGALVGALAASLMTAVGVHIPSALWMLAAMGGMIAAAGGAVLGSSVIVLEMTGHPEMAAPVLLTAVIAYAVRRLLLRQSQSGYTWALADGVWQVPENSYARLWRKWTQK
jgi:CIC family chloride channel protein